MGKFKLDKNGIQKIRNMLEGQVVEVEKRLACSAYNYFVNFAYKKSGGGEFPGGGGWTLYYLSNWNVCINGIDKSVSPAERQLSNSDGNPVVYSVDREKAKWITEEAWCGDSISVTNSVWYGDILNSGGNFGENDFCKPNRFIELCQGHIKNNVITIINQVAKECPNI